MPIAVSVAASAGMTGGLVFDIGLSKWWAVGGWTASMMTAAGLTFYAERSSAVETIDRAEGQRYVDQLEREPVFAGRTTLAQALCAALSDVSPADRFPRSGVETQSRASVVVVHGAAGAGKTTLALYSAHQVKRSFPDGRLYVNLRGDGSMPVSAGDALEHFLRSLGIAPTEVPRTVGDRAALFRSLAESLRILVFLDNAHSTEQIRPLIPAGPGCAVLITSRRALSVGNIGHRRMVRVALPESSDALAVLSCWAGEERVREDPATAVDIIQFCGHLPIALKIVGAKLAARPDLTLAMMRTRLEDERHRIRELRDDNESLHACLLLTYEDLSPAGQRLLGAIATLPAGRLTPWHFQLFHEADPHHEIDELVETCMVDAAGTAGDPTPSYRLHDLIRVFAAEQHGVMPPEQRHTRLRAAIEGYARTALRLAAFRAPEIATDESVSPLRELDGLLGPEWIAAEADRIVWACGKAHEVGAGEAAPRLAEALACFVDDIPIVAERVTDLFETTAAGHEPSAGAVPHPPPGTTPAPHPRSADACRRALATLLSGRRDNAAALAHLDTAPESNPYAAARAEVLRAWIVREEEGFVAAERRMTAAVEQLRRLDDRWHLAQALEMLGELRRWIGNPSDGEQCQREALAIIEEFQDVRARARLRRTLGETLGYQRRLTEAAQLLGDALGDFRQLGDRSWQARTYYSLGNVQRALGRRNEALRGFDKALRIFEQLGDPMWVGRVHNARSRVFAGLSDYVRAYADQETALQIFEEQGHDLWYAHTLRFVGWLHIRTGCHQDALVPLEQVARTTKAAGDAHSEAAARYLLGIAHRELGHFAAARTEFEAANAIFARGNYQWNHAACTQDFVRMLRAAGEHAEADRLTEALMRENPHFPNMRDRDGAVTVPDED
ncbi:tetratricopeptide repeat protein [Streptomyces tuirus]